MRSGLKRPTRLRPLTIATFSRAQETLDQGETSLLSILAGEALTTQASAEYQAVLSFLREQARHLPNDVVGHLVGISRRDEHGLDQAVAWNMFDVLVGIAQALVEIAHPTIDSVIDSLLSEGTIDVQCGYQRRQDARKVVVASLGWLTCLYDISDPQYSNIANADFTTHDVYKPLYSVEQIDPERPISEFLEQFWLEILPGERLTLNEWDGKDSKIKSPSQNLSDSFLVNYLNIAALKRVGSLDIIWTSALTAHLELDTVARRLKLFRLPTFCSMSLHINSLLTRIFRDGHSDVSLENNRLPLPGDLLEEVLLSYVLLIGDDRSSRRMFKRFERQKASGYRQPDPVLDSLCRLEKTDEGDAKWLPEASTGSYSKTKSFPILGGRLDDLQDFMRHQQPNHLFTLWYDRRDHYRWYTLWAVILLGGIGLMLALVQIALSAMQVYLGFRALPKP